MIQAVVEKGVCGTAVSSLSQFFLCRLLDKGYSDALLTIMIKNGANPNCVQRGEDSVLMKATKKKRHTLCCVLMEADADLNFRDSEGMTAFDIFTGIVLSNYSITGRNLLIIYFQQSEADATSTLLSQTSLLSFPYCKF